MIDYSIINDYRISNDLTWMEFGKQFFEETGIPWKTLHKIVRCKSTPNARNKFKLDRWIAAHSEQLDAVTK